MLPIKTIFLAFGFSFFNVPASAIEPFNQKLLVISFDGFRQMYFDGKTFLPWFEWFRQRGVYSDQVQSIFPSETFPNHYGIATGMYAESHGIVANSFYDPVLKQTFKKSDIDPVWWNQAEPIWITARKQGLRTSASFWPGSAVTFAGGWSANYFDQFDKTVPFDKRLNETIHHLLNDDVTLAMFYLWQPDEDAHNFGVPSTQVDDQLMNADWYLSIILQSLENVGLGDDKLNIILCADHGGTNLTNFMYLDDYVSIDQYIERIPSYGTVTNLQPKQGKLETVIESLAGSGRSFAVYRKQDLPESYHYSNNDRIMDVVVEANLGGYMFPNQPASWLPAGGHGYNPTLAEMKPMFMAKGPAFKRNGYKAKKMFATKDIYAIMAFVIGMEPLQTNASLADVMDIFSEEPPFTTTPSGAASVYQVFYPYCILCLLFAMKYL